MNTYIENSNDSNFFLYLAPDSSPKGPHPYGVIQPKRYMDESFCIETITRWSSQNTNEATFSCTGAQTVAPRAICPLTDLFSRTDTWMNLLVLKLLHVGVYKNTNDSNFLLCRGPDSSPQGHMPPNWFIQPNRYMNESSCIETITCWSLQKHQWQQLSPVQGPRQ